jgi:hypothetical protein
MSLDKRVKMSHSSIGSSRQNAKAPSAETIQKGQALVTEANNVFNNLDASAEESKIADEPRMANFKDLVFLGKLTKRVQIAGWNFDIHTMDVQEQRSLLTEILKLPPEDRLLYSKPYTIWMVLDFINDAPIDVAAKAAGFESAIEFICSWQDLLIDKLFGEYESLAKESKAVFSTETIENDVKKS